MDQLDNAIFDGYKDTGAGIEIPHAYEDDFGGRSGMERVHGRDLVLPPPVDDPPMDEELVSTKKSVLRANTAPQQRISAAESPPPAPASAPPLPVSGVRRTVARVEEAVTADRQTVSPDSNISPTYVNIVLTGDFGSFKSKAADVRFCENHIALVYTGRPGDEEMLFEPPHSKKFDLKVESNDGFKSYPVCHFGLTTSLPDLGIVVVVLPRSNEKFEDIDNVSISADDEAEHSF